MLLKIYTSLMKAILRRPVLISFPTNAQLAPRHGTHYGNGHTRHARLTIIAHGTEKWSPNYTCPVTNYAGRSQYSSSVPSHCDETDAEIEYEAPAIEAVVVSGGPSRGEIGKVWDADVLAARICCGGSR
jgi:hypothetical protein